jgi:hypothetical protein
MSRNNEGWASWITGLVFGVALALGFFLGGVPLLFVGVALLLAAAVGARSLALLSGGLVGLGGSWTGLLLAANARCEAFDRLPNSGCTVPADNGAFLAVYLVILALGVGLGGVAARRHRSGAAV